MIRRQKITTLLLSYLNDISIANGYLTDVDSVSLWLTKISPKANQKILNLRDTINDHQDGDGRTELLTVMVDIACKTSDSYTTVTNLINDVLKAFNDNSAAIGTALSESGVFWIPVNEEIELDLSNEAEMAEGIVTMILVHRFYEKWKPDETIY